MNRYCFKFYLIYLALIHLSYGVTHPQQANTLKSAQQLMSDHIYVNNVRSTIAASNLANSKTVGYVPKTVIVSTKPTLRKHQHARIKQVYHQNNKTRQVNDPSHPYANEHGMVTLPDVDQATMMMDMNQAKIDTERAMKIYHLLSDQRLKLLQMANN